MVQGSQLVLEVVVVGAATLEQGPQKSSESRTRFNIIGACRGGRSECVIGRRVIINSSGIESQMGMMLIRQTVILHCPLSIRRK